MGSQHLLQRGLSEKDRNLLADCGRLVDDAHFVPKGDYSEYRNGEAEQVLRKLEQLDIIKVWETFKTSLVPGLRLLLQSRAQVLVLRFQAPAALPVKNGDTVLLLPVRIFNGTAAVSDVKLEVGSCYRLTKDVRVAPRFDCVLLRIRSQ